MRRKSNVRVLFVCLGNICRSPLAEGLFQKKVNERGFNDVIEIDSAGTGAWHVGESPDRRMRETARKHGLSLDHLRGRQAHPVDLEDFDLILAMDSTNLDTLKTWDSDRVADRKIRLFREFDPIPDRLDVPDPYYRGAGGFDEVYEIVKRTADSLLDWIIEEYQLAES